MNTSPTMRPPSAEAQAILRELGFPKDVEQSGVEVANDLRICAHPRGRQAAQHGAPMYLAMS